MQAMLKAQTLLRHEVIATQRWHDARGWAQQLVISGTQQTPESEKWLLTTARGKYIE